MSEVTYKHRKSLLERARGVWARYREVKQGIFGLAVVIWFFIMAVVAPVMFPLYPGQLVMVGPNYAAPQWMSWTSPADVGNYIGTPGMNFIPDPYFDYDTTWVMNDSNPQGSYYWDYTDFVHSNTGTNRSLVLVLNDNDNNETFSGSEVYSEGEFVWEYWPPALTYLLFSVKLEVTGNLTDNSVRPYFELQNPALDDPIVNPIHYVFRVYPEYPDDWYRYRRQYTSQVTGRAFQPGETVGLKIGLEFTETDETLTGEVRFWVDDIQLWSYSNFWGPLGTTDAGQDVMAQLFWGAQVSLFIGLVATFIGVAVGLLLGLAAGYFGGAIDEAAMRVTDFFIIMPTLPIMMILSALMSPSLGITVFVIALFAWPGPARVIRSQVLVEKEKAYVEAARAAGAGDVYLIFRHVFPNVLTLVFVQLATGVSGAILSEAGLSFLGLTPQNLVSWGRMLQAAYARGAMQQTPPAWWFFLPPGFCIALLSMGFVFIGYAVDKALNPRLRRL